MPGAAQQVERFAVSFDPAAPLWDDRANMHDGSPVW
jgi:hypothetical protein